jgi:ribonuclease HII
MKRKKIKLENNFEEYEEALYNMGFSCVCGVDEVGRGPWAGPITAAAVIINKISNLKFQKLEINDSKKLTENKRENIFNELIKNKDIIYSIASISAGEIDRIGLGVANQLVLKRAIEGLSQKVDYALIDGFTLKNLEIKHEGIIKGDQKVLSIAAASIIAKVSRDRYMIELSKKYPQYGFEEHKGYGTKKHIEALKKFGTCPEHRKSFKPIAKLISN